MVFLLEMKKPTSMNPENGRTLAGYEVKQRGIGEGAARGATGRQLGG
ncbi:MAG: hypothetical protein HZT41_10050 [Dechloromonas sp.]|nr:MAG: hypothetical protein HZT41_10050 [Dechloromonas sp.]